MAGSTQRTNIVIDMELMGEAQERAGLATMRETVEHVLREYVRAQRRKDIFELAGQVEWTGDLSEMRRGRSG